MNIKGQNTQEDKNEDQQREKKIDRKDAEQQGKKEKNQQKKSAEMQSELKEEINKWKQNYMRTLADYENLEKRTHQQISLFQKKDKKNILLKFLDVLDDIEQGIVFVKDKGLQLVKDKFVRILSEEGIQELEVMGKTFDPFTAECVEVVAGKKDNGIIEVLRKGYSLNSEVIRPARVKVEKKTE